MFKVFNQRLAGFLMFKGFKLLAVEPNKKIQDFNVFSFEKTNKLTDAINQYSYLKNLIN